MLTRDFDYQLPGERIAQVPAEPRDSARLLVVRRDRPETFRHFRFAQLDQLLVGGDLLVANDTRVIPSRLAGRKAATGGAVEALLLRQCGHHSWQALVRGHVRPGTRLAFGEADRCIAAEVVEVRDDGVRVLRFDRSPSKVLHQLGRIPLPPYITQPAIPDERYQTVFARADGSAAAPTAGLHFTPQLMGRLANAGIGFAFVTLHVGLDTFRPMQCDRIEDHRLHREWCAVDELAVAAVERCRARGRRVVGVGTTSVRALETAAAASQGALGPYSGWTDLYIRPGHTFRAVDAMITNFHLPRSSLLVMVAAFAGKELLERAYGCALASEYRFLSFGDAMLIL